MTQKRDTLLGHVAASPELYINLLQQHPIKTKGSYQTLYYIFMLALAFGYPILFWDELGWVSLWMLLVFPVNGYQMYIRSTGKDPLGILGKRYLHLSDREFILKDKGHKKPIVVQWQEVKSMDIRLFHVVLGMKSGKKRDISLEKLSDENLQQVKHRLNVIKHQYSFQGIDAAS
ncbi:hypothetical protein ACXYMU_05710 [Pontibacter sp. CAU 1760]